jgi:hypothetical protein
VELGLELYWKLKLRVEVESWKLRIGVEVGFGGRPVGEEWDGIIQYAVSISYVTSNMLHCLSFISGLLQ